MFYLSYVFQFIVYRFNNRPFSDKNLVVYVHKNILHVVLDLGNKLNSVQEVLWIWILWFRQTRKGVESTKLMPANIRYMRQFYQCFPFCHALSDKLTWTHWRTLLKVQDETVRNFYLTECISGNWSVRQLERQINTLFYERMLASKDQKTVREEIQRSVPQALEPKEIIRDPYILEFIEFLSSPLPQPRIVGMMFFLSLSNIVKE